MSQCECTAQWQRINELATTTRRRHDDDAKTSISCETSSTFHTLKVRTVSQCECTAQWQRINELATTTRRRGDDEATTRRRRGSKTKRTQVQPQTPTINGNPSLRIREKTIFSTQHPASKLLPSQNAPDIGAEQGAHKLGDQFLYQIRAWKNETGFCLLVTCFLQIN